MSYNGWTNYETWVVALWIDNEESTHNERRRMAQECWDDSPDYKQVSQWGIWTREQGAKYALADRLKDWTESDLLPDLGASLAADLLGAAISEVNWNEIAENWLDDVAKEEVS